MSKISNPRNGDIVPRTYVALDLETTGLNSNRDKIIEIGAVRFRDGKPVGQYSTLINPGRSIPYEIQQLTGISNADVAGQPRLDQVADQIMRFVGHNPVVGHNVSFDLDFMRARGLLTENVGLDTWELATILLPNQSGYSLGALAERFGLGLENHHRALDDALAAGHLFRRLCEEATQLPRPILLEISRLTQDSGWPLARVFVEALTAIGVTRIPRRGLSLKQLVPDSPMFRPLQTFDPLTPRENPAAIDVAELAGMLAPSGAVAQAFPGYEFRPPQLAMLEAVATAFNQSHHLMVEAGTGTGKSLAYLLPAIAFATKNGQRIVVSTNTINLQDQLFRKDLPDLQRILGQANAGSQKAERGTPPFRAALLKGRGNYLCPRRFAALKARPNLTEDELRGIARILVWLPTTQTGDQSELSLPKPSDRFVWNQVSADNEGCSLERCQREMGGSCFFYRARRQAEAAHILVVNHALLLADAATDNRVLPEYHRLIIDEAHHLEDAVTDQLSFRADSYLLSQLLAAISPPGSDLSSRDAVQSSLKDSAVRQAHHPSKARALSHRNAARSSTKSGLLAEIQAGVRQPRLPKKLADTINDQVVQLQKDLEAVRFRADNFWDVLKDVMSELQPRAGRSEYDIRVRITDAVRQQPLWVEIEVSWENLALTWQQLLRRLETLHSALQELGASGLDPVGLDSLIEDLGLSGRRLTEFYAQMEAWVVKPDPNGVYWAEISASTRRFQRLTLRSAPLHVGPLVQKHIFFHNDTVVLTSATLRTAGSFEYLRDRLSAHDADTTTVGSPFDYQESTLLYLPSDLPEPTASGYQTAVEQALISLTRALGGRTLALFTSYAQLRRTARAITPALTEAGITVLSQSGGSSRHQILKSFKTDANTVLLGTRSFWEGVDVVGPALSALVLVRLPFAVPSDPVVAARSETFDNPFYDYSVPDAILRFRQGFGRLIRSKTDRGVVVVLDKRIQSKQYGQLFLDSLPECTVQRGPLVNLPSAARRWIERGQE